MNNIKTKKYFIVSLIFFAFAVFIFFLPPHIFFNIYYKLFSLPPYSPADAFNLFPAEALIPFMIIFLLLAISAVFLGIWLIFLLINKLKNNVKP